MAEVLQLDFQDFQEEVQLQTEPPPRKKRPQLLKRDVRAICRNLSLIKPAEVLPAVCIRVDGDATYFEAFPERATAWRHIRSTASFPELVKQLITGYIDLYKTHHRGKDKYSHFLMESNESPAAYPQSKDAVSDHDASVIRVSGFALHSSIHFRRKALGRLCSRYTAKSLEQFVRELWLLEKMKATNKSFVPTALKFQDRGCMVIMHPVLLPFGHSLFSSVRSYVNYKSYQENGPDVFAQARTHLLDNTEILSLFKSGIQTIPHGSTEADKFADEAVVCSVYQVIITKMLNTINNDFLKNLSMLDRISSNKGTGAKLMLRDKLKGLAADTQTRVPQIEHLIWTCVIAEHTVYI